MLRCLACIATAVLVATAAHPAAAQLPPEVIADSHLLRAEELVARNAGAASAAMDEYLAITAGGTVALDAAHHYRSARVLEVLGRWADTFRAVSTYLAEVGRDGDNYVDALRLLNRAAPLAAAERDSEPGLAALNRAGPGSDPRDIETLRRVTARRFLAELEFVDVPAGDFSMGLSDPDRAWQYPRTGVRITRGFSIARHEVTQTLYYVVTGDNPARFRDCPRCPVENMSWDGIAVFLELANGIDPDWRYRLPTEAEWEYAARAGRDGDNLSDDIDAAAWHNRNSDGRTHPAGSREANALGIHDMLGNVEEVVSDWLAPYPGGLLVDPQGPEGPGLQAGRAGPDKVARGGSWDDNREEASIAVRRHHEIVGAGVATQGFRLVRERR